MGEKVGDNNQVIALAEALGWGWEEKHFTYIPLELIPNRLLGVTLLGIKNRDEVNLSPPWPDLVITAGRRNEPIARWIQQQTKGAGKIALMGRPWADPHLFDLIITTPQYNLDDAPNILRNELPLHRINPTALTEAAAMWQEKLAHLPRPWTAVFVGGNSSTVRFTAPSLVYLAKTANQMAQVEQGSLLITTSARTPEGTSALLSKHISAPSYFHDFSADQPANPYLAYLALADRFIVTGESISMLTECCSIGKPVHVFDPTHANHFGDPSDAQDNEIEMSRPGRAIGTWLRNNFGPKRLRRDITQIHKNLITSKRALWLGENESNLIQAPQSSDLERAAKRTKDLFS